MMRSPVGREKKELTAQSSPFDNFNYNLDRLLEMLSSCYPEDQDLAYYREKLASVISANYKLPCTLFVKIIQQHQEFIPPIMTANDQYFLQELNYKDLIENPKYLALIQKIMSLWTSSDNLDLKKTIGKYLILLLCNGVRAMKNAELVVIINQYRKKPLLLS